MMKRTAFVIIGILLAGVIITAGCTSNTNMPTMPAMPAMPTQNITGVLKNVVKPAAGNSTLTVQNQQGNMTVSITPNTAVFIDGQACTVDQLAALQLANASYNCTTVFYIDGNGQMVTVDVNVTKIVP
jgi:hypothetical protein